MYASNNQTAVLRNRLRNCVCVCVCAMQRESNMEEFCVLKRNMLCRRRRRRPTHKIVTCYGFFCE